MDIEQFFLDSDEDDEQPNDASLPDFVMSDDTFSFLSVAEESPPSNLILDIFGTPSESDLLTPIFTDPIASPFSDEMPQAADTTNQRSSSSNSITSEQAAANLASQDAPPALFKASSLGQYTTDAALEVAMAAWNARPNAQSDSRPATDKDEDDQPMTPATPVVSDDDADSPSENNPTTAEASSSSSSNSAPKIQFIPAKSRSSEQAVTNLASQDAPPLFEASPLDRDTALQVAMETCNARPNAQNGSRPATGNKEKVPLTCKICKKTFANLSNLRRHKKIHTGRKIFSCRLCNHNYTTRTNTNKHLRMVHKKKNPGAYIIVRDNNDNHSPDSSSSSSSAISNVPLNISLDAAMAECKILSDENTCSSFTLLACCYCNKPFKNYNLKPHLKIHLKIKDFVCTHCGKGFTRKASLDSHKITHLNPINPEPKIDLQCSSCDKTFKNQYYLRLHQATHTGEKRFSCRLCNDNFITRSATNKHLRTTHNIEEPGNHVIVHDDNDNYSPDSSSSSSSAISNVPLNVSLDAAMAECKVLSDESTHLSSTLLACCYCNNSFQRYGNLKRHLKIHLKIKDFVCTDCGKGFTRKAHLDSHKITHRNPKPEPKPEPKINL